MTTRLDELQAALASVQRDAPLPWQWWTSNSMRRLSSASGKDGDVAHAYRSPYDGVADISITTQRQALIVDAVNALPDLIAAAKTLSDVRKKIEGLPHAFAYGDSRRQEMRDLLFFIDAALAPLTGHSDALAELTGDV